MTLADAITRLPRPFESDRAAEALGAVPWADGAARALIEGAAGCSPHLGGLIARHGMWLEAAFDDPDAAVRAETEGIAAGGLKETAGALRQAKGRIALIAALADLGGVWPLDRVTGVLTDFADRAVAVALVTALGPDVARGKIPGATEADLGEACGIVALAMGKMGAHELNYSSDIDLICLFDDARYDLDPGEVRPALVKTVRRAMALLSDITGEGYVFRTDLRLRPDPSVTPIVMSIDAAERYYEGLGRTWERAAFVKARPCAGDVAAGERFLKHVGPFIWRRNLDFTTVEDAQAIRKKIRAHKGQAGDTLDGRNLKLDPGGIREIEFFTQTRQLIAGGRDPDLRVRQTRAALDRLAAKDWVPRDVATQLDADYMRLRELEHRVQMVRDAQTHHLPKTAEDWSRLAAFTGADAADDLRGEIRALVDRVHALTEDFFAPSRAAPEAPPMTETAERLVDRWQSYPALRSERARAIFARILPTLLKGFERAADPDGAIIQFDRFLSGLPAGVQLFSLFEANPPLIDLMVDISSTAPALARYLSDNPGVLDAVIGGDFFEDWPGLEPLAAELSAQLDNPDLDYERRLDAARYWQKERHFRIGVHHLRGLIGPDEAAAEYSDLAQAVLGAVGTQVMHEFARKYGTVDGGGAIVVGMGSLGARALSAGSDLDLIVIYDADPDAISDGRRQIDARTYYARLTKAVITALSAQTAAGTLYEVDMRLRPSGRQGPAATAWRSFRSYQRGEAWTWEHLALTRARVMAGPPDLAAAFEAFRRETLDAARDRERVLTDLADMRRRLAEAKPQSGMWDVSGGPGGLQDIELFGQAAALLAGAPARRSADQLALTEALAGTEAPGALVSAHRRFSAVKAVARLLTDADLDPDALGPGGRAMLLRDAGVADLDALAAALAADRAAARAIIDAAVPAAIAED